MVFLIGILYANRHTPVSYTHLDVYKRQLVAFADDVGLLSGIDIIGVTVVAVVELLYSAS